MTHHNKQVQRPQKFSKVDTVKRERPISETEGRVAILE